MRTIKSDNLNPRKAHISLTTPLYAVLSPLRFSVCVNTEDEIFSQEGYKEPTQDTIYLLPTPLYAATFVLRFLF